MGIFEVFAIYTMGLGVAWIIACILVAIHNKFFVDHDSEAEQVRRHCSRQKSK
jgi:hypothetical protein